MPSISIYTPTHNPAYLLDCWESLKAQQHADWEWVVVPNGPDAYIPDALKNERRLVVRPWSGDPNPTIGALKAFAIQQTSGDLLVELDHDDLLHETALRRILEVQQESGAGFLYSDFVNFFPSGLSRTYAAHNGWQDYPVSWRDRDYRACRAFQVDANSLTSVLYAPNHVRVWTRDAYEQAGGYDTTLPICDDFDLVCRTYVAGVPFCHIPEPLYWYREHQNTYATRTDEIAKLSQQVSNRHFYKTVQRWATDQNLPCLFVGPGRCPDGFVSDPRISSAVGGLPFATSSLAVVRIYDYLQSLNPAAAFTLLNEAWRVLAPGGWLQVRVLSTNGPAGLTYPLARSYWNQTSWRYYTRHRWRQSIPGNLACFQDTRVWEADEGGDRICYADLCAYKGQRMAGYLDVPPPADQAAVAKEGSRAELESAAELQ